MNHLLEGSNVLSFEEEDELIKRFLLTLESELAQSQISPSTFQEDVEFFSNFPQILSTFFQNLYVRENYINVLISIINHLLDRHRNLFDEKQRNSEKFIQEIERLKESLEITRKRATDLENAYNREEQAKNELYSELGDLEDRSNQLKELFINAKVEIEDYKEILNYQKGIEESLKKSKETLKIVQEENINLKEKNRFLQENNDKLKSELDIYKQRHKDSQEAHDLLNQENKKLKIVQRTLSQNFHSLVIENEKIAERNQELIQKISSLDHDQLLSEEDSHDEIETMSKIPVNQNLMRTSIEANLFNKRINNHHRFSKTESILSPGIIGMKKSDANMDANMAESGGKHERVESLFNEILALKENEIIGDVVFEEGFEKINRLNSEAKNWGPRISELEIGFSEKLIWTPKNVDRGEIKSLFHSKQMISMTGDERKDRRKTYLESGFKNERILQRNDVKTYKFEEVLKDQDLFINMVGLLIQMLV